LKSENVHIRLVGPNLLSAKALSQLGEVLEVAGPIQRSRMHEEFAQADLFVLPSLSEGSAIVCYEALAAGLPVLTTTNAGSVVRDNKEGWIVPICDAQAIADRISLAVRNRPLLEQMSQAAFTRANEYTWDKYAERLIRAVATSEEKPLE